MYTTDQHLYEFSYFYTSKNFRNEFITERFSGTDPLDAFLKFIENLEYPLLDCVPVIWTDSSDGTHNIHFRDMTRDEKIQTLRTKFAAYVFDDIMDYEIDQMLYAHHEQAFLRVVTSSSEIKFCLPDAPLSYDTFTFTEIFPHDFASGRKFTTLEHDESDVPWIYWVEYREYRKWPDQAYGEIMGDAYYFSTTLAGAQSWIRSEAESFRRNNDAPHEFWIFADPVDHPDYIQNRMISKWDDQGEMIYDFENRITGTGQNILNNLG